MKNQRHERLCEIIRTYGVQTQDEITRILKKEGYKVTQATVSRDLKDLKISKVSCGKGVYKYVREDDIEAQSAVEMSIARGMIGSVIYVRCAKNIVVVKTIPGFAQGVASSVDEVRDQRILGCVAGDDTIMIVTVSEKAAMLVCMAIERQLASVKNGW